jgi:anti-sigma28 factor (negative regulator of flagellin synthesis)
MAQGNSYERKGQAIAPTEEIRWNLIRRIRSAINSGEYYVSSPDVAHAVINTMLQSRPSLQLSSDKSVGENR